MLKILSCFAYLAIDVFTIAVTANQEIRAARELEKIIASPFLAPVRADVGSRQQDPVAPGVARCLEADRGPSPTHAENAHGTRKIWPLTGSLARDPLGSPVTSRVENGAKGTRTRP